MVFNIVFGERDTRVSLFVTGLDLLLVMVSDHRDIYDEGGWGGGLNPHNRASSLKNIVQL